MERGAWSRPSLAAPSAALCLGVRLCCRTLESKGSCHYWLGKLPEDAVEKQSSVLVMTAVVLYNRKQNNHFTVAKTHRIGLSLSELEKESKRGI